MAEINLFFWDKIHFFCLFTFSICIRGTQRSSERKGETVNKIDLDLNEDHLLTERLKAVEDS